MNHNLLFDFTVNKENNTIHITREFNAPLALVWQAWTTSELLDQWFGPSPFRAETISMDFREGGCWRYSLTSDEYGKQWGRTDYHKIVNLKYFTASDSFLDEHQNLIPEYPVSQWKIDFTQKDHLTIIKVTTKYTSIEDLEKMIKWGYMDGFKAVTRNLDLLIETLNKTT